MLERVPDDLVGERQPVAVPAQQAQLGRLVDGGGELGRRPAEQGGRLLGREAAAEPPALHQQPPDRRRQLVQQAPDDRENTIGQPLGHHRGGAVRDDHLPGLDERAEDVLHQPRVAAAASRPAEHGRIRSGTEDAGAEGGHRLVVQRPQVQPCPGVFDQPVDGVLGERRSGHRPPGEQPQHRRVGQ
jgi:hypothetical protein